eukprot:25745-Eustigmatos_ZCMA.PRE.1
MVQDCLDGYGMERGKSGALHVRRNFHEYLRLLIVITPMMNVLTPCYSIIGSTSPLTSAREKGQVPRRLHTNCGGPSAC